VNLYVDGFLRDESSAFSISVLQRHCASGSHHFARRDEPSAEACSQKGSKCESYVCPAFHQSVQGPPLSFLKPNMLAAPLSVFTGRLL
jgi:hypothetical protein